MQEQINVIPERQTPHKDIYQSSKSDGHLKDSLEFFALRMLGQQLWETLYILLSAMRSCLGHIRTQLAKDHRSVNLGQSFENTSQSLRRNTRTLARKQGIENLLATYPWADYQDLEMFLTGFDAGEKWCLCNTASDTVQHPVPHSS
jgi:hypothetical protein